MTMGISARAAQCLALIEGSFADRGIAPTHEELRVSLGYASKNSVNRLMNELVERGRIRRIAKRARACEILRTPLCPHCGNPVGSSACIDAANRVQPAPRERAGFSSGSAASGMRLAAGGLHPQEPRR